MKRNKMKKRKSKRLFTKTAQKVNSRNNPASYNMRGGIRF